MTPTIRPKTANRPLVFAHRGASGTVPEGTVAAFQAAVNLGVDALELDVHQTRDGVLVAAHDDTLDRMTDGHGAIRDQAWVDVRRADAGYWFTRDGGMTYPYRGLGFRLPRLAEVFERFGRLQLNIDIKQDQPPIVEPFLALLRRYDLTDRVVVGSFHDDTLAALRRTAPEIATAATMSEVRRFTQLNLAGLGRLFRTEARAFQVPERHGRWRVVTPRSVRVLHRLGIAVHVWTVNEATDLRRLIAYGVDGLMTDFPQRLLCILGRDRVAYDEDTIPVARIASE